MTKIEATIPKKAKRVRVVMNGPAIERVEYSLGAKRGKWHEANETIVTKPPKR